MVVHTTYVTTQQSAEVEALQRMRDGVLLVFIGWIFLGLGILLVAGSVFAGVMGGLMGGAGGLGAAIAGLVGALVLVLVGAVISLVGIYSKFVPGSGDLARADPEFSTAATLIKVGYVWGLILLIVGAILAIVVVGVFIALVGYILMILGFIGTIVLCFKLNDKYANTLYLVAGILFILGILFAIMGVIAWILLYVALGETIRRLRTQQVPTTQSFLTQV